MLASAGRAPRAAPRPPPRAPSPFPDDAPEDDELDFGTVLILDGIERLIALAS